jgi:hypothetical protein
MALTRSEVTVASRVMLPLYPALYLSVGLAFMFQSEERTSGDAFDVARLLLPVLGWGVVFVTVAVVEVIALLTHNRAAYLWALIPGSGLAAFWSVVIFSSTLDSEVVSYSACMWVAGMSVAQMASARSLARHEMSP